MSRPKTINKAEERNAEKAETKFVEVTKEEYEAMTPDQQKNYKKNKTKHDRSVKRNQEKAALDGAKDKVAPRIDLLEAVVKIPLAKRGEVSCEPIDVTFACPVKKVNLITENWLLSHFYEGDLIQVNCHAIPKIKVPCVVVQNGVLYFAQKIKEDGNEYQNLSSDAPHEMERLIVADSEYVGNVVNIISSPQRLLMKPHAAE